jgi:hypothetical protein
MSKLATVSNTDISNQIGALELDDHVESHSDGVLEASVQSPQPFTTACSIPGCLPH